MLIDKKYNKVFISYASEDFETANDIHNYLTINNFEPWIDKKNILPGQNWDKEILNALKISDFIIILLSQISVEKRGYVQKEYKLAIRFLEEKLDYEKWYCAHYHVQKSIDRIRFLYENIRRIG